MKLRCDLHINGGSRKLILVPSVTETGEHLGLKLSAVLLFWAQDPIVDASLKHPSLVNQEFLPDLVSFDETGAVKVWIECGKTALHKLKKLTRRYPQARILVHKPSPQDATRFRKELETRLDRHEAVEILAWPEGRFKEWMGALRENNEAYGESGERSLNLVLNDHPVAVDMLSF
ncbi:MAG: YaeQ family protein [Elusimicrobiota bacterium]